MRKSWFVYILECADGSFYTGITTNLERRLAEHNLSNKGAKYTKNRRPVILKFSEQHINQSQARKRELSIQKLTKEQKKILWKKNRAAF